LRSGPWTTHLFKLKPWSPTAFVVALCVLAAAVGLRMLFNRLGTTFYFATFLPAVLIASLLAGAPAGACAALLSIPIVWWAFLPPMFAFSRPTPADYRDFTMFLLESGLLIWFAQLCREAMMLQQMESSGEF
jgi:K+-sensing histidine kinase KdpD